MTKMSKVKINARRKEQSTERKVKSAQRQLSHVQMEAQIAALEAQIALLKGEGIGKFSQGNREEVKTESLSPLEKSPLEKSPSPPISLSFQPFLERLETLRLKRRFCRRVNIVERHTLGLGDAFGRLKFRRKTFRSVRQERGFSVDVSPAGFDARLFPMQNVAQGRDAPHTERRGMFEQDRLHPFDLLAATEHRQLDARSLLFHLNRRRIDVERLGLPKFFDAIPDQFAAHIVEIRFQHPDDFVVIVFRA